VLGALVYEPRREEVGLGVLEAALDAAIAARAARERIKDAQRRGVLARDAADPVASALERGVISNADAESLRAAERARDRAIQVDAFPRSTVER
jgi:acyl-CoA dehydrogenase